MASAIFQAFEYASYNINNEGKEGKKLPEDLYDALKSYSGEKELPYYSLTATGVRFKNYVGALQIGKWTVEVLPKFDRGIPTNSAQPILIQMLRQSGVLKTNAPTESELRIKRNYILETYLRMFLDETKSILHRGLIKKYHKQEENAYAMKGSLNFNKHLNKNLIHAERFYVKHTIYDQQHELNRVLYKTLKVILGLNASYHLVSEIKSFALNMSALTDIHVSDEFFERIKWNRKNEHYKTAIEIARLLLLNYHPDLSHGRNNVLALMFDMNDLWEKWFVKRLRVVASDLGLPVSIKEQIKKDFWKSYKGVSIKQKPDIVIEIPEGKRIIVDTKWKIIHFRPSEDDLRQMFTYNLLFKSDRSYLVYPGEWKMISGEYFENTQNGNCGLAFVPFIKDGKLSDEGIEIFLKNCINE